MRANANRLPIPRSLLADSRMDGPKAGWHPRMSSRLGPFRLVQLPGSQQAIFTKPITVADEIVEAGRD
jgi:hypothetical protein